MSNRATANKVNIPRRPSGTSASTSTSRQPTRSSAAGQPSLQSSAPVDEQPPDDDDTPSIPPDLLTTLIHEAFTDEKTRISKKADTAVGKYVEIFVREAVARAVYERGLKEQEMGGNGVGGGFLEVSGTPSWRKLGLGEGMLENDGDG